MPTEPKTQLRQTHRLSMTPALLQAIGLLQMNTAEVNAFLLAQSAENPFLKLPANGSPLARGTPTGSDFGPEALAIADRPTLHAHLQDQIDALKFNASERRLAGMLLDALDATGWIGIDLAAAAAEAGTGTQAAEALLTRLQSLDPPGVFARSLSECLKLQLREQGRLSAKAQAVLDALDVLPTGQIAAVAEKSGQTVAEVRAVLDLLRTLDPKPGLAFATEEPARTITPDVVVTQTAHGWQVDLNGSDLPSLTIDHDLMRRAAAETSRPERMREFRRAYGTARWIAAAVRHRNETLLALAGELVRRQTPFVESGPGRLVPLRQKDVAAALGLSESAVSRIVRNSWAQLPRAVVPLRDFFARGLSTGTSEMSVTQIKELIRLHVGNENPARPHSDAAIRDWLEAQGIPLSRRTVAKYRLALGLPGMSGRGKAGRPDRSEAGRAKGPCQGTITPRPAKRRFLKSSSAVLMSPSLYCE